MFCLTCFVSSAFLFFVSSELLGEHQIPSTELDIHQNASINPVVPILPPPPTPGNRRAFTHLVSSGDRAFAILSWYGGWALAYPGANPGHLTFERWMSLSGRTWPLSKTGSSVRD